MTKVAVIGLQTELLDVFIEDTSAGVPQRFKNTQRAIDLSGSTSNDPKRLRLLKMIPTVHHRCRVFTVFTIVSLTDLAQRARKRLPRGCLVWKNSSDLG